MKKNVLGVGHVSNTVTPTERLPVVREEDSYVLLSNGQANVQEGLSDLLVAQDSRTMHSLDLDEGVWWTNTSPSDAETVVPVSLGTRGCSIDQICLAQAPTSTDAGGGLVQQDDDSGYGALGWGDAGLGLLVLAGIAAAAGGGGGGSTVNEFQPIVFTSVDLGGADIFARPVRQTGNEYDSTNAGGSKLPLFSVNLDPLNPDPTNIRLNLPGDLTPDSVAPVGNASPGTFEVLFGNFDGTTFFSGVAGDDLLVLWDGSYPSGRDVGFVLENFWTAGDADVGLSGKQVSLVIDGWTATVTTTNANTLALSGWTLLPA